MSLIEVGTGYPYASIQAAINAAPSGGNVRVNAGGAGNTYAEAVLINNKRIHLYGGLDDQGVTIAGAGGGAAPALQVTGTGGVFLENFRFSNAGSAATYVVELNVAEDWASRCIIDGGGVARCIQGQFTDHLLLYNGTHGLVPSCPGQVFTIHCTCVDMSVQGIQGNANNLEAVACLGYNCNALAFVNGLTQFCAWNFADDLTAPGPLSRINMTLADIGFLNYAGGDYRLDINSQAYVQGISIMPVDIRAKRRLRAGFAPRIYGGYWDPYPAAPSYLTGASQIRAMG